MSFNDFDDFNNFSNNNSNNGFNDGFDDFGGNNNSSSNNFNDFGGSNQNDNQNFGGGPYVEKNKKSSFDIITLIVSLLAGIAGFYLSTKVYDSLGDLWSPLAIGIRITIFFLILALVVFVVSLIRGNQDSAGKNAGLLALCLIACLLVSTGFEFIYELNFFDTEFVYTEPTGYAFIIDESGSMETSDPNDQRYDAIEEIISDEDDDFPFAIYTFSDQVNCEREAAPLEEDETITITAEGMGGGTAIRDTLEYMLDEYKDGKLDDLGDNPKFLLLSDGVPSYYQNVSDYNNILGQYADNNIAISTVGLGEAYEPIMQAIADQTGGVFVSVDDASELNNAMSSAIEGSSDRYSRTFFTHRYVKSLNVLYMFMRIIFTALIGLLISLAMLFATGRDEDFQMILVTGIATSLLGGLLLEFLINGANLSPYIVSMIYFILVALTFVNKDTVISNFVRGGVYQGGKYQPKHNDQLGQRKRQHDNQDKHIGF